MPRPPAPVQVSRDADFVATLAPFAEDLQVGACRTNDVGNGASSFKALCGTQFLLCFGAQLWTRHGFLSLVRSVSKGERRQKSTKRRMGPQPQLTVVAVAFVAMMQGAYIVKNLKELIEVPRTSRMETTT